MNPKHLFLGSHLDNMKDMARKGRSFSLRGERNGGAKLTEDKVLEIRQLGKTTHLDKKAMSQLFSVKLRAIYKILNYESWNYPEILKREANA